MTDNNRNVVWSRDYYPFGASRIASGSDEMNKYTYEGIEKDLEIDLWYNTARFFNDEGRFTQVDPLWQKYPSMSPYVRVANNPLRYVDPDGEIVMDAHQVKSFEQAFESSVSKWYSSLHSLNTSIRESGVGYLGDPRRDTILEQPIKFDSEYPGVKGIKAAVMSIMTAFGHDKFNPVRYYGESQKYGRLILHTKEMGVSVQNIVRIADRSGETLDPNKTLYSIKLINSEGEVVGRLEMNQDKYRNFLDIVEETGMQVQDNR